MDMNRVAVEVFTILQSYNYSCTLFDQDAQQVFEPEEARRFAAKKKNLLVAIVDDGDNSKIKLYFRKDIPAESLMGLMDTLRMTATKYNMTFSSREQDHDITPKDFSTKMSVSEGRHHLSEGMYGTSRSSYLRLENARMIVRHAGKINEELMGARGRNIDSIYVENKDGERMLFPTKQLAPARAMAHHVNNGGVWTDEGGQDILALANEYADLREMARHIHRNTGSLTEGAQVVREQCRDGMKKLRRTFEGICRKTKYEDVMASIRKPLNEGGDLAESITKLKQQVAVEGCEIEPRVFETTARCMREASDEQSSGRTSIMGVKVDSGVWNSFKSGELALGEHLHQPSFTGDYKAYYSEVLGAAAAACKDPHMAQVFTKVSEEWQDEPSRAVQAFTAHLMTALDWELPKKRSPMDSVEEFSEWIDSHDAKTLDEEVPVEAEDAEVLDETSPEDDQLDEDDTYITQGVEPEDGDLTLDDVIIPTNQGKSFRSEVTVNTVVDPDTGEEEVPDAGYIDRLRGLAGIR